MKTHSAAPAEVPHFRISSFRSPELYRLYLPFLLRRVRHLFRPYRLRLT